MRGIFFAAQYGSPMPLVNDVKKPGEVESVSEETMRFRVREMQRCIEDPIYFCRNYYYIRSIDKGTILLPLYPKQEELILAILMNRFTVCLAARQSGKTTAYIAVALYMCFFMSGKEIVILANKEQTAIGILRRIKRAYEWIPRDKSWIKPGIVKWSEKQIEFENGCSITAMASSSDSARSASVALLLIDEAGFIPANIMNELWESVFPTVSRSETSKVCMVSTANGIGGLFYDIWTDATIGGNARWKSVLIDWWDVPGRNEAWKQEQIRGFGPGGEQKFAQEFGNRFLGSAPTLLDSTVLRELADVHQESIGYEEEKWTIGSEKLGRFDVTLYRRPEKTRSYVLGADVSEGIGLDYSVAKVFDVTDLMNVEEVATFSSNTLSGPLFGYVMAKMARLYNDAYVACERNGVSVSAIDALWRTFEYDNIVDVGSNKYAIGIFSNHATKLEACLHFRDLLSDPDFTLVLHDGRTIMELQRFEKVKARSMTAYAASTGHDDLTMATIWAMYVLKQDILEQYYQVSSYRVSRFGAEVPARLARDFSQEPTGSYFTTQDEWEALEARKMNAADEKLKLLEGPKESGGNDGDDSSDDSPVYDFVVRS